MKKIYHIALPVAILWGIDAEAQTQIGSFYYDLNETDKTATLKRSDDYKSMTDIVLPSTVTDNGTTYTVTSIGQQAFQECTNLKTIQLPSTLKLIDQWAFYGCTGLTSIELPESLEELVTYAFQRCSGLESVKFNDALTTIGASAFTNCTSLKEANLPKNLKTLDVGAFNNCSSLSAVTFGPNIESIGQNAFYSCGLTEFTFPESLTSFGGGILSQNKKLTKVTFAANMKTTGQQTVRECTALTQVVIPEGIDNLGDGTFYGCSAIEELTLPSTLTSLSSNCLYGCSLLKSVELPAAITEIPSAAFYDCSSLKTLPGGNNITSIGKSAFYGCSSLTEISLSTSLNVIPSHCFDRCVSLTKVTIPNSVTEFEDSPFHYCTSLKTLNIPASVVSMPGNPAIGASSLEAYNVDAANPKFASEDSVLYDKEITSIIAFPGAKTFYNMPETVEVITDFAFNNLSNLKQVTFSKNLKSIGQSAFYGSGLTSVDLSDTQVESIGMTAFFLLTSISEFIFPNTDFTLGSTCLGGIGVSNLVFPEGVTSIGIQNDTPASVFSMGSNLKSIWLPSTLKQIVPFGGSSSKLQVIYSWATTPAEFVAGTTVELPKGTVIKVPKGTKSAYEQAWKEVYTNATYDDCLPTEPTINAETDNINIAWDVYTDNLYPANIARYELNLYNGSNTDSTPLFTKEFEQSGNVALSLGQYERGNYTVTVKGYTQRNQLVMGFTKQFEVSESGIDEILSPADAEQIRYDLSGRRVLTPQKGQLYIVGGKIVKF
ncbi:MAG: leucine-rich repeat domain-containing protein [Bacteroides sp.]|nr:leucine-rich repeat domain-containing protein [Bacteroides sp.]MCM1379860.1 leucine-rich repeat domain-containing protein [Bacteroides sp.]MCM1446108.1 leucine-rich repeat domain-containing protein [Prevotella sp.]